MEAYYVMTYGAKSGFPPFCRRSLKIMKQEVIFWQKKLWTP